MLYSYTCQECQYEEDEFRSVADRFTLPTIHCPICDARDWKLREVYLPQRVYSLKGENENFPLRSHIKDSNGNRMVFNNKRQYEQELKSRGLAIAGNDKIGAPPAAVPKPSKRLESHPVFRKMQDQKQETKFISESEVKEWTAPKVK